MYLDRPARSSRTGRRTSLSDPPGRDLVILAASIGAVLGAILMPSLLVAGAREVEQTIFGAPGKFHLTWHLVFIALIGALIGAGVAATWAYLGTFASAITGALAAVMLLYVAFAPVFQAYSGTLSVDHLTQTAKITGDRVCVQQLDEAIRTRPDPPGLLPLPPGRYLVLDSGLSATTRLATVDQTPFVRHSYVDELGRAGCGLAR